MATKKDLVEAYSFSRRRLVTAFVSGAPGGREVEPTRPGRSLVGGIALAVLLVAGALVLGIIKSPSVVDWDKEGLISEKGTGADYVNITPADGTTPELRPIINITSAMLLLGPDVESQQVSKEDIATRSPGETIGILQAPTTPPDAGGLIQSGWTACTTAVDGDPQGITVRVSDKPATVETPDASFAVRTESGSYYLIAAAASGWDRSPLTRAHAYPVAGTDTRVLDAVAQTAGEAAVPVPDAFVTLFPAGLPLSLKTLGVAVKKIGKPSKLTGKSTVPDRARVGDKLTLGGLTYLLLEDRYLRLDDFSEAVYDGAYPADLPSAHSYEIDGLPTVGDIVDASELPGAYWPTRTTVEKPTGALCAVLDAVPGRDPGVTLARAEPGSAASTESDLPPEQVRQVVDSAGGALVDAGDWDAAGVSRMALVDNRGVAYSLPGTPEREALGYADVPHVVVPGAWVDLFQDGVALSIDAARCPPTSEDSGEPCGGS
ncbi:N/A [soil metagenome]